jgi:superfamily II DNA/RNA helicase
MTEHDPAGRTRRFGRPPKPAETVRSERVVSFVTPVEFRQLKKISDRRGVSLSAVIHSMVVRSLKSSAGEPTKIGNNNQRSET